MKAKHNNKDVLVTHVTADLTWALVTTDLENKKGIYKVDVINLEEYDQFELEELAQKK
jgi:hypothetical protein